MLRSQAESGVGLEDCLQEGLDAGLGVSLRKDEPVSFGPAVSGKCCFCGCVSGQTAVPGEAIGSRSVSRCGTHFA
jgi:hypothetical protein